MIPLQPLEASLFIKQPKHIQTILQQSGVIPVNDLYMPYWGGTDKMLLLYGSYGSGKSIFIVDDLINKCRTLPYFRCYFGRKVLDKVRGSTHQTIIDRLKDLNLTHEFDFSEKPNGTMVVSHKRTGNKFVPFGGDNSESLKGIKDPTHIYCDEFDQFDEEDFKFLYSRLRTVKASTQFYAAFNTEHLFQSHWVVKMFFDGEFASKTVKIKSTYRDNQFLNHDEYYDQLCLIANGNMVLLNAIANGEFGIIRTGGEFFKDFREDKHIKAVRYDQEQTIHIVVDENVNPYVSVQFWQILERNLRQINELPCESPNNNAPRAADATAKYLNDIGYKNVIYLYGDASGNKRSTVDENSLSFFDKFVDQLKSHGFAVVRRINKANPRVALSGAFINEIYRTNLYGYSISISNECSRSIEDYIRVKEDADGSMKKEKVKDPKTGVTYEKVGHMSDCKRYICTTILQREFMEWSKRSKRRGSISVEG